MIDFILPGMLGFSLLGAAVFGVAFVFFNLRQTLVLKRFYATPINRKNIVFGEALSRVCFQMMTSIVIILAGHYFFHFTLVNGFMTFLEMMVLSFIGTYCIYGIWIHHQQCCKKRKFYSSFRQYFYTSTISAGGHFFSDHCFSQMATEIL